MAGVLSDRRYAAAVRDDRLAERDLGTTGVRVTEMGLGCGPLVGFAGCPVDDDTAHATLSTAWDAGVRYFDTAPWYGLGMSEHRVGRFLRSKPRSSYVLSTKVGRLVSRPAKPASFRPTAFWANALPFEWRFDYRRDAVLRSYEDSLQRLGVNRTNLVLIHDIELGAHGSAEALEARFDELDGGGGFGALEELRASGSIDAIGIGLNQAEAVRPFLERFDVDVVLLAGCYTLLESSALEEALPTCAERGISVVAGGVFNSGILATGIVPDATFDYRVASPEIVERVRRLIEVCKRHGVELGAAALRFPLAHDAVVAVIPGAATPGEVRENAAHLAQAIPDEFWVDLQREALLPLDVPVPIGRVA